MKTMNERMLNAVDHLIEKAHPYESKHHDIEKAMAVYICSDEMVFCHVVEVDKWHDTSEAERDYIEKFMQEWMLEQEDIPLGTMILALAEFIVKDEDKALVRIEYNA